MTPEDILLVQATFDVLLPISTAVAERFYSHLFDVAPTVRSRFPDDMRGQYDMLMAVINTAVHGLWHPDALAPILQQLGRRHVGYGTHTADYDLVGEVLLYTLRHYLGTQFTVEVEAAWTTAYIFIATTMQTGAADVASLAEAPVEPSGKV
jgi:hemoglobin-like flavoprotein